MKYTIHLPKGTLAIKAITVDARRVQVQLDTTGNIGLLAFRTPLGDGVRFEPSGLVFSFDITALPKVAGAPPDTIWDAWQEATARLLAATVEGKVTEQGPEQGRLQRLRNV
jgi:hypothetical protein